MRQASGPGSAACPRSVLDFHRAEGESLALLRSALERTVVLKLAGVAESITVEGSGSRIEARGSGFETHFGPEYLRAIPTQSILDVRVSRTISVGGAGRIELLLDVLNVLNDAAEEALATDILISPNFGHPTVFMDPRRAMLGVRLNLGR